MFKTVMIVIILMMIIKLFKQLKSSHLVAKPLMLTRLSNSIRLQAPRKLLNRMNHLMCKLTLLMQLRIILQAIAARIEKTRQGLA